MTYSKSSCLIVANGQVHKFYNTDNKVKLKIKDRYRTVKGPTPINATSEQVEAHRQNGNYPHGNYPRPSGEWVIRMRELKLRPHCVYYQDHDPRKINTVETTVEKGLIFDDKVSSLNLVGIPHRGSWKEEGLVTTWTQSEEKPLTSPTKFHKHKQLPVVGSFIESGEIIRVLVGDKGLWKVYKYPYMDTKFKTEATAHCFHHPGQNDNTPHVVTLHKNGKIEFWKIAPGELKLEWYGHANQKHSARFDHEVVALSNMSAQGGQVVTASRTHVICTSIEFQEGGLLTYKGMVDDDSKITDIKWMGLNSKECVNQPIILTDILGSFWSNNYDFALACGRRIYIHRYDTHDFLLFAEVPEGKGNIVSMVAWRRPDGKEQIAVSCDNGWVHIYSYYGRYLEDSIPFSVDTSKGIYPHLQLRDASPGGDNWPHLLAVVPKGMVNGKHSTKFFDLRYYLPKSEVDDAIYEAQRSLMEGVDPRFKWPEFKKDNPQLAATYRKARKQHTEARQWDSALQEAIKTYEHSGGHLDLHRLAVCYGHATGDWTGCFALYLQSSRVCLGHTGDLKMKSDDYYIKQAEWMLGVAARDSGGNAKIVHALVKFYHYLGRANSEYAPLEGISTIHDLYAKAGELFHNNGEYDEARKCYKTAVSLNPSQETFYRMMATSYVAEKNNELAGLALLEGAPVVPKDKQRQLYLEADGHFHNILGVFPFHYLQPYQQWLLNKDNYDPGEAFCHMHGWSANPNMHGWDTNKYVNSPDSKASKFRIACRKELTKFDKKYWTKNFSPKDNLEEIIVLYRRMGPGKAEKVAKWTSELCRYHTDKKEFKKAERVAFEELRGQGGKSICLLESLEQIYSTGYLRERLHGCLYLLAELHEEKAEAATDKMAAEWHRKQALLCYTKGALKKHRPPGFVLGSQHHAVGLANYWGKEGNLRKRVDYLHLALVRARSNEDAELTRDTFAELAHLDFHGISEKKVPKLTGYVAYFDQKRQTDENTSRINQLEKKQEVLRREIAGLKRGTERLKSDNRLLEARIARAERRLDQHDDKLKQHERKIKQNQLEIEWNQRKINENKRKIKQLETATEKHRKRLDGIDKRQDKMQKAHDNLDLAIRSFFSLADQKQRRREELRKARAKLQESEAEKGRIVLSLKKGLVAIADPHKVRGEEGTRGLVMFDLKRGYTLKKHVNEIVNARCLTASEDRRFLASVTKEYVTVWPVKESDLGERTRWSQKELMKRSKKNPPESVSRVEWEDDDRTLVNSKTKEVIYQAK